MGFGTALPATQTLLPRRQQEGHDSAHAGRIVRILPATTLSTEVHVLGVKAARVVWMSAKDACGHTMLPGLQGLKYVEFSMPVCRWSSAQCQLVCTTTPRPGSGCFLLRLVLASMMTMQCTRPLLAGLGLALVVACSSGHTSSVHDAASPDGLPTGGRAGAGGAPGTGGANTDDSRGSGGTSGGSGGSATGTGGQTEGSGGIGTGGIGSIGIVLDV